MSETMNYGDLSVVTEVGNFGSLNIEDPTEKKVKKRNNEMGVDMDIDEMIRQSIEQNKNL